VPPKTIHPDEPLYAVESYTTTPVFGSATAETSAIARLAQPVLAEASAASAVLYSERPEPAPDQTISVQLRVSAALLRLLPTTAVT